MCSRFRYNLTDPNIFFVFCFCCFKCCCFFSSLSISFVSHSVHRIIDMRTICAFIITILSLSELLREDEEGFFLFEGRHEISNNVDCATDKASDHLVHIAV